jgi:hypothetical protein
LWLATQYGRPMPFEFDLEKDFDTAPFTDAWGVVIIEFALGYDLPETAIIMSVMLVPIRKTHDLRFGIRERDMAHTWKVTDPNYTIETVRKYIPKPNRDEVRECLIKAVGYLIEQTAQNKVTMETVYANLPENALKKYDEISDAIHEYGMITENHFQHANGKYYWLFSKQD